MEDNHTALRDALDKLLDAARADTSVASLTITYSVKGPTILIIKHRPAPTGRCESLLSCQRKAGHGGSCNTTRGDC